MKRAVSVAGRDKLSLRAIAVCCLSLAFFCQIATPALAAGRGQVVPPLISSPQPGTGSLWQRNANSPYSVVLFAKTDHTCPAWHRAWHTAAGNEVGIVVWTCQFPNDAAVALWNLLFIQGKNNGSTYPYFHPARYPDFWAESASTGLDDRPVTTVAFARSRYVVIAAAQTSMSASATAALASALADEEANELPGPTSHLTAPPLVDKAFSEFISAALLAYLVIILPLRWIRNPLAGQRYQVRRGDPRWDDLTQDANKLKWLLRLRGLARFIFYLACAGGVGEIATHNFPVSAIIFAAIAGWFGWIRPVGRSLRRWKVRRVRGLAVASRAGWLELFFAFVSFACVIGALGVVVLALFIYSYGLANSPMVVGGVLDPRYLGIASQWQQGIVALLVAISPQDLLEVGGLAVLLLVGLATLLRRLGRRFALADAIQAQHADERPPILYLRNFSDDVLAMPSSSLARTSLIERLSIVRRQPFEEILVRHLRTKGPVIALSHPSARLPAIGAARLTLPNSEWQDQIQTWIAKAGMVVVAVTPPKASDGLSWEIERLAAATNVPVVFVFSPYKERDLVFRWWQFAQKAATFPRFSELSRYLEHNSGAHFMAERPGFGWVVWGARTRSEFTYATAWWEAAGAAEEYRRQDNLAST